MFLFKPPAYIVPNTHLETIHVNGFTITSRVEFDDTTNPKDVKRDEGFWPRRSDFMCDKSYFDALNKCRQIIKDWEEDRWFYGGVVLSVARSGVFLDKYAAALWGIEINYPDSDNDYLLEVANELLPEALAQAHKTMKQLIEEYAA